MWNAKTKSHWENQNIALSSTTTTDIAQFQVLKSRYQEAQKGTINDLGIKIKTWNELRMASPDYFNGQFKGKNL